MVNKCDLLDGDYYGLPFGIMSKEINKNEERQFDEIVEMILSAKKKAIQAVNSEMLELYWNVGKYLSEKLESSDWGEKTVKKLANFVSKNHPELKGFGVTNLYRMRQFHESYRGHAIVAALRQQLSWTHHRMIFAHCKSIEEKEFYLRLAIKEKLSTRELERQIDSGYFERSMLSAEKLKLSKLPEEAYSIIKDTYTFEFLDLPKGHSEKDLRKGLVHCLKEFLLELGSDFTFMGEEYRLQVGNSDFFVDLLFFHRELNCIIAFELKIEKFKPGHLGQLQFYLEALDRDVRKEHENPSIGILLCSSKDDAVVEYALSRSLTPTMVAEYETKLLPKKLLQQKLSEFYSMSEDHD